MSVWTKRMDGKMIIFESPKRNLEVFHNSRDTWSVVQYMKGGYDERFLGEFDNKTQALAFVKGYMKKHGAG